MDSAKPPRVKDQLAELEVKPSKQRGQNFLHREETASRIADFSGVGEQDLVLEIGPGLGMLSRQLSARAKRLIVVEVDRRLADDLEKNIPGISVDDIICQDVRTVELSSIAKARDANKLCVVANAPYSISSEIVAWVIEQREFVSSATLLLQKEFAERAAADPGSKRYGALSVFCGQYTSAELGFVVDGKQFHPPANVDSRLIKLTIREQPRAAVADPITFREVVRTAFSMRRKMLSNSLSSVCGLGESSAAAELLNDVGIDPKRRPETLSIEEFAAISNEVSARKAT